MNAKKLMEWCLELQKEYKEDLWWSLFWNLLWGIWLKRNAWIFNARKTPVLETVNKASKFGNEWEMANAKECRREDIGPQLNRVWKPPEMGIYKINCDAALFGGNRVGLGGVVRDHTGEVMLATCELLEGEFLVEEVEALAARHTLQTAMQAGLRNVVIETDNLKLHTHLKKGHRENSSFGGLVADIIKLAKSCISCSFSHVCRGGMRLPML